MLSSATAAIPGAAAHRRGLFTAPLSRTPAAATATHTATHRPRFTPTASGRCLHAAAAAANAAAGGAPAGGQSPLKSSPQSATPRQLGFRMPAESEPHAGTWMSFPHDRFLWRDGAVPAQQQHAAVATAISQFEQVWMLADPEVWDLARSVFRGVSGVEVVRLPTNDVWTRDWGPTCVVRDDPVTGHREVAAVHWDYNCYGAPLKKDWGHPVLMPDWSKDRAAGRELPRRANLVRAFDCPMHLEGGAVQSDGQGTVLVTEQCLLHPSRNPHLDRDSIEALLREYLGADRVMWLWRGMVGDEEGTNGHVDNVAAFAEPGTLLLAWSDDATDSQHEVSASNLSALEGREDARGRPLRVVKVPCPSPQIRVSPHEVSSLAARGAAAGYGTALAAGFRLPASYINHYVVNAGVVVPQFGGEQSRSDEEALAVLASAYPGRRVVGVQSRELLLGGGNIHCLTQNLPAAFTTKR